MKFCHWLHSDGKSCKKLTFHRHSSGEKLFTTCTHQTWWAAVNSSEHQSTPFSFLRKTPKYTISVMTSVAARKESYHRNYVSFCKAQNTLDLPCAALQMLPCPQRWDLCTTENWGFLFFFNAFFLIFAAILWASCIYSVLLTLNFWTKWKLDIQKQAGRIIL